MSRRAVRRYVHSGRWWGGRSTRIPREECRRETRAEQLGNHLIFVRGLAATTKCLRFIRGVKRNSEYIFAYPHRSLAGLLFHNGGLNICILSLGAWDEWDQNIKGKGQITGEGTLRRKNGNLEAGAGFFLGKRFKRKEYSFPYALLRRFSSIFNENTRWMWPLFHSMDIEALDDKFLRFNLFSSAPWNLRILNERWVIKLVTGSAGNE